MRKYAFVSEYFATVSWTDKWKGPPENDASSEAGQREHSVHRDKHSRVQVIYTFNTQHTTKNAFHLHLAVKPCAVSIALSLAVLPLLWLKTEKVNRPNFRHSISFWIIIFLIQR